MIAGWLGEKFKWIKDLWNWAMSFISVIKSEFPKKLKDSIPKSELAKFTNGLKDVNYKWMSDHSTNAQGENLFPIVSKLGSLPKFLFWCLGSRCSGGGDCTLQNTRHECNEHKGDERCRGKIGEDPQGACEEINSDRYPNEDLRKKCTTHMPYHSKYTGCHWEEPQKCEWGNDIKECFRRIRMELCNSINTKRCANGQFLLRTNACTFASFLAPDNGKKRSINEWKQIVSKHDGKVGYWNADPHASERCCHTDLHDATKEGSCVPEMIVNENCIFPWFFKSAEYTGCLKSHDGAYSWCSHAKTYVQRTVEIDTSVEGKDWSKCYENGKKNRLFDDFANKDPKPYDVSLASQSNTDLNTVERITSMNGKTHRSQCFGEPTCTVGIQAAKNWVIQNGPLAFSELTTKEVNEQIPEWKCLNKERFHTLPPFSKIRLELNLTYAAEELRRPEVIYEPIVWDSNVLNALKDPGSKGCTSSSPCNTCEGNCNNDTECKGSLKCFERSLIQMNTLVPVIKGSLKSPASHTLVPGCDAGGAGDVSTYDYCYAEDSVEDRVTCDWIRYPQSGCRNKRTVLGKATRMNYYDCIQEIGASQSYCGFRTPIIGPWDVMKTGISHFRKAGFSEMPACWVVPTQGSNDTIYPLNDRDMYGKDMDGKDRFPLPFIKQTWKHMFPGECTSGSEIRMYEDTDNPGNTPLERIHECGIACRDKKTALSGSWDGFKALGFTVIPATGRCYCEDAPSKSCTQTDLQAYHRYDFKNQSTLPQLQLFMDPLFMEPVFGINKNYFYKRNERRINEQCLPTGVIVDWKSEKAEEETTKGSDWDLLRDARLTYPIGDGPWIRKDPDNNLCVPCMPGTFINADKNIDGSCKMREVMDS